MTSLEETASKEGRSIVGRVLRDRSGQDLAEYGLLGALIAVAVVAVLTLFGGAVMAFFTRVLDELPF